MVNGVVVVEGIIVDTGEAGGVELATDVIGTVEEVGVGFVAAVAVVVVVGWLDPGSLPIWPSPP